MDILDVQMLFLMPIATLLRGRSCALGTSASVKAVKAFMLAFFAARSLMFVCNALRWMILRVHRIFAFSIELACRGVMEAGGEKEHVADRLDTEHPPSPPLVGIYPASRLCICLDNATYALVNSRSPSVYPAVRQPSLPIPIAI